jgi:hypothetical protein
MSTHFLGFSLLSWVLANLCVSLFMTGVIWFVQIVHYPLFAKVGTGEFIAYERNHADRTGYVVAAPMIFELCASFVLSYLTRHSPLSMLANVALALTLIVWIATFALQVPCHNRLGKGFDEAVHMRLVRTNWLRTVGWTLRSGVLVALLLRVLG